MAKFPEFEEFITSVGECLETDYCPHCGARMDGGED